MRNGGRFPGVLVQLREAAAKQHEDRLWKKPNVVGIAVGRKNDDLELGWSVRILVSRKVNQPTGKESIPATLKIVQGGTTILVPTDVVHVASMVTTAAMGTGMDLNVKPSSSRTREGDCACVFEHRQEAIHPLFNQGMDERVFVLEMEIDARGTISNGACDLTHRETIVPFLDEQMTR